RSLFEARKLATQSEILNDSGKYDDAIKTGAQGVELAESVLGPDDPNVGWMLFKLAGTLRTKGELDKAEQMNQRALDIERKAFGEEDPRTAMVIGGQGLMRVSR